MDRKKKRVRKCSTRQLINMRTMTEHGVDTYDGDSLVFLMVRPTNLSVLSVASVAAKVHALTNVLKSLEEIEILCVNSRENFEGNKNYLRRRVEEETNPMVSGLLEKDVEFLDKIQVQMATAREFLVIIRFHEPKGNEMFFHMDQIEKMLNEQGLSASRGEKKDIKRILMVYFEQNVTSEYLEDFDGERFLQ